MTLSSKFTTTLVLIPSPGIGHLVPAMELAKQLAARDLRLIVTVFLIKLPVLDDKLESYLLSMKSNPSLNNRVMLVDMPVHDPNSYKSGYLTRYVESYQSIVKEAVDGLRSEGPVGGIIYDLMCSAMVDVADELGIPSYLFFTCGVGLLSMMFHLRGRGVNVSEEYDVVKNPDAAIELPGFRNPVPVGVWPGVFLEKHDGSGGFLAHVDKYRRAKGILVNTFIELEREMLHSMGSENNDGIPPVFPVGPILNVSADDKDESSPSEDPTMRWLDDQPPQSVVFLCFGSRGSFNDTQVKEIALGLERSGQRFLWSLRIRPKSQGGNGIPLEPNDASNVLPEGFLERTGGRGRVIGWAPQAKVLGHAAVRAFVSHCGWNSTLESLWFGVPVIAWPIYAEQQMNAFLLVKELGIATEIRIDYRQDFGIDMVVEAAEVEDKIRKATTSTTTEIVRKKVKEMSEETKKATREGGSSYESLGQFIKSVFESLS